MPTPREQLASLLRQSRLDAGYDSHGVLAKKLNVSRPVITRAENAAHPVPSDAVLTAWAGVTGVALDTLAKRAKSGTPDWFMPYRQAEAGAGILRYWSPLLVPGVLQTESYMRAVLSVEPYTAGRLDELVVCKGLGFSLGALDAGEDLVGVLGPGERLRVVVPVVDEG
ncbi:MAG: helix-turn-helix domain-containing protein, partial [Actinomycetota bacterium]|nr:helix-turn-helix domain-containing protein [Actinomycetota bacterium]